MEADVSFTFETVYDQRAMTAMARALRKTVRRKRNRRVRIFGIIAAVLGILVSLFPGDGGFAFDFRTGFTWFAVLLIALVLLFEDQLNGALGVKRLPPGTTKSVVTFMPEGYTSDTELGSSRFSYDHISVIAEMPRYFVLGFGANHAQIYDKNTLKGGTVEEFRHFLEKMTARQVQQVK